MESIQTGSDPATAPLHLDEKCIKSDTAWNEELARLSAAGPRGLLAIGEFLSLNIDNRLAPAVRQIVGQETLRMGLLAVLVQKADAGEILAQELLVKLAPTLAEPGELAMVGRWLARALPDEYRTYVVQLTRETIRRDADSGSDAQDVAPLFGLLREFADGTTASEVISFGRHWPSYAAWTLAGLPNGEGSQFLQTVALGHDGQAGEGLRRAAMGQLAELTFDSDLARAAVLKAVEEEQVPALLWPRLAQALAGDRMEPALEATVSEDFRTGYYPGAAGAQNLQTYDALHKPDLWRIESQVQFVEQLRQRISDGETQSRLAWVQERLMAALEVRRITLLDGK